MCLQVLTIPDYGGIMPRLFKKGRGGYAVTMLRREVYDFSRTWPCCTLPDAAITFEFDARGDLVDVLPYRIADKVDGQEALALCDDAQNYALGRFRDIFESEQPAKRRMRYCPNCGGDRVRFIPGPGPLGGMWGCADCHLWWPPTQD